MSTARTQPIICMCGDPIIGCACGGSVCPGWRHPGDWGGHWCREGQKAQPREAERKIGPGYFERNDARHPPGEATRRREARG